MNSVQNGCEKEDWLVIEVILDRTHQSSVQDRFPANQDSFRVEISTARPQAFGMDVRFAIPQAQGLPSL